MEDVLNRTKGFLCEEQDQKPYAQRLPNHSQTKHLLTGRASTLWLGSALPANHFQERVDVTPDFIEVDHTLQVCISEDKNTSTPKCLEKNPDSNLTTTCLYILSAKTLIMDPNTWM